jgi:NAD(P)-dependent dehydrogenase (short-subunit alcohol dehydrogenase family)
VNLRGPVFLVQEALPDLKASPAAAVLNMVSVGAFQFAPAVSMYAAGKAALLSFTRSMAAAYAQDGIRVNALAPGPVDTDMMRNNPQEAIEMMVGATLLNRLASPDEMVGAALLLTSDAGSYITGQVIIADGGGTPR